MSVQPATSKTDLLNQMRSLENERSIADRASIKTMEAAAARIFSSLPKEERDAARRILVGEAVLLAGRLISSDKKIGELTYEYLVGGGAVDKLAEFMAQAIEQRRKIQMSE